MLEKEIFSKLFNNIILKSLIFAYVKKIHRLFNLKQFGWEKLLTLPNIIVYYNYLEDLKNIPIDSILSFKDKLSPDLLYCAVKYDRLEIVQYLITSQRFVNVKWNYKEALTISVNAGSLDIYNYIIEKSKVNLRSLGIRQLCDTVMNAASKNRIEIIDQILEIIEMDKNELAVLIIKGGVRGNCLEVIKHYLPSTENENDYNLSFSIPELCSSYMNSYEILDYLHKNGFPMHVSHSSIGYVISGGNLDIVKWFFTNFKEFFKRSDLIDMASEYGHLEIVKWLHQNLTEGCTTEAMDHAAKNGHLHVVRWLHENRTEGCTFESINMASFNGHLDTIDWIYKNRSEDFSNT